MQYFASKNPSIAFTHIFPGSVNTPAFKTALDFGWIFAPLTWILVGIFGRFSVPPVHFNSCFTVKLDTNPITQEFCAEHMLHALFDGEKGVFLRNDTGILLGRTCSMSPSRIFTIPAPTLLLIHRKGSSMGRL
jgi:hypothetical protein